MTETTQDTHIHKLLIDDEYKERALSQVKEMVQGNKYDPEDVKLESFDGEVLQFQCENMLTILRKNTQKIVPGKIESAVKVENESAAHDAMNKAYLTLSEDKDLERKIRSVVLNRSDEGFAANNIIIPLPFWKKDFVVIAPCATCRATGSVKCLPCAGKGQEQCPKCNGSGMGHCSQCHGAQMVQGPNNNKIQCPVCHGNGRTSCTSCNQSGMIRCSTCRTKVVTTCPNCQGHAWASTIYTMEIEIKTAFDYPRTKLPEKIVEMMDRHGVKIKNHAKITVSQALESSVNTEDLQKAKEQATSDLNKDYRIPVIYDVVLPYGHAEYNIADKSYYTFLFGTQSQLTHVSPFLDDLLKNGIRKLHDAAEHRGDIADNLKQASEYRTLREGILYTASYSLGKARNLLKKTNKLGLSDNAIKDIIIQTDSALKHVTKKPREKGLLFASLGHLILLGLYYLTPLRSKIIAHIPNPNMHIAFDALTLIASIFFGIIIIQSTAQSAMQKLLHHIMPNNVKKSTPPKLGDVAYWNIGIALIIAMLIIESSRQFALNSPLWYINLF